MTAPATANALRQPRSPSELFISFTLLALQGFGGVVAIVQRELVERKQWLTQDEFLEDWAVAQVMPGPNVVNLSMMIGGRHFGLRGAIAALAGMLLVPLLLVLCLALLHARIGDHPGVAGAFRGMAAAAAGMFAASALRLSAALARNPMPLAWCVALALMVFVLVALLRVPLLHVLPIAGACACVLCYRRLRS
ncbi:chromate transporter [Massilia sp. PAMC28688]|uniref:chromate transporter n=1 Tax=Massilia sp. PAMC28688 TaxID=2861283 RepID=UPI001C62C36B|nr:chromate transporter [Massilia sp. PAMC28688]QYF92804.1 chromate transporter [Massilia sp. PAMC28688]